MKQRTFTIKIESPCHENLAAMNSTAEGKFCTSCHKTVVDFSNMNNEKIAAYFKVNTGRVCGQFKSTQLNMKHTYVYKSPWNFNTAFLKFSLAGILTFASVSSFAQTNKKIPTCTKDDSGNKKNNVESKVQSEMVGQAVYIEQKDFTVKITTDLNGAAIANATIFVVESNQSFTTDVFGKVILVLPDSLKDKEIHLQISARGYEPSSKNIKYAELKTGDLIVSLSLVQVIMTAGAVHYTENIPNIPVKKTETKKEKTKTNTNPKKKSGK